jgi:hypothetical protein
MTPIPCVPVFGRRVGNGLLDLPADKIAKPDPAGLVFPQVQKYLPFFQGKDYPKPGRRGKRIGLDAIDRQFILGKKIEAFDILIGLVAFIMNTEQGLFQIIGWFHAFAPNDFLRLISKSGQGVIKEMTQSLFSP